MTAITPVSIASQIDPGFMRLRATVPSGLSLAEIVARTVPGTSPADWKHLRVFLQSRFGMEMVPMGHWRLCKPRPGIKVVIRVVPGKGSLGSILSIVVSVAAIALAPVVAPYILGTAAGATAWGIAAVGAAISIVGYLMISALIPPIEGPDAPDRRFTITGWRNRFAPAAPVPCVMGQIRYAPPFAATTHTEIVGDWQYVRALFTFGYGPLELTDFRLGDTSLSEYDDVEIEVRSGLPDDDPVSLYPRQIAEQSVGAELSRLLPRDEFGNIRWGVPVPFTPVVRTTGPDAAGASVILSWPAGLVRMGSKGQRVTWSSSVRVEQRQLGAEEWQLVHTINVSARKLESFFRQHTWQFPSRGRWQIRLTALNSEVENDQVQDRCIWAALQTLRPEYPVAFDQPQTLVAMRVRATNQLNGALEDFSALVRRICLDWDQPTGTWIMRATRNPASLFRHVLQSAASSRPVPDSGLDLEILQEWHDFCRLKGLHYDKALDAETTQQDILREIAGAGRASPRHDGMRWGVTIDRPQDLIIEHISPRNSSQFSARRAYLTPPHGFRVTFQDAQNDYKTTERTIPWPGHVGPVELTEALEMPGKTDAAEVWRETRRRQYEVIHRADTYQVMVDGAAQVATRGDRVALSHDVLNSVQRAARIRHAIGSLIELDEELTIDADTDYAIRFRRFSAEDTIGESIVRRVTAPVGRTRVLTLTGSAELPMPGAGDLVLFGVHGEETFDLIVGGVEAGEDFSSILRLIDAAPIIDQLTDAEVPPPWSARVGEEIDQIALQPGAPRFVAIRSGVASTGSANRLEIEVAPALDAVQVASIDIDHRLRGAPDWTTVTVSVADGGTVIDTYTNRQRVELRARSRAIGGFPGPYHATIDFVVGAGDLDPPLPLDPEAVSVTTLLGGALVQIATGDDPNITHLQLYRSTSAVLDRDTDAVGIPMAVGAQQSYSVSVGDTTRSNLAFNGGFNTVQGWALGDGWAIADGVATHAAGLAGDLSRDISVSSGKFYRIGYVTRDASAGTLQPRFLGGSMRAGAVTGSNGAHRGRIQAVTGNDTLNFTASDAFDGSLDNVVAYLETSACLAQGLHYLWLEPQNEDGVPGPVSGPFVVDVI